MSSKGNGQQELYTLHISITVQATLHQQRKHAHEKGKGHYFLAALRQILERLKKEPREFGEPRYRLPGLKLLMYHAAVAPIVVHYGVHEEKQAVFISRIISLL